MKLLIVPDKFKGTLTALEAAEAIAAGWKGVRPNDSLELLPMSDGGDGFGQVLSSLLGAIPQKIKTMDAAHRPCESLWWWHADSKTAIVETAQVIGLALLPAGKYHPFELDTEGLATVFEAAAAAGAERCLVGIGGSATNDAGFGLARGLGWQFFGLHDEKIVRWTELRDLALLKPAEAERWFEELIVAVDVQNPLLGPRGCTRVYGPQKGLRAEEFEFAEQCLAQLVSVVEKQMHLRAANEPGVGAAGGLGYGLRCFAGAKLEPGFALFAKHADLLSRIRSVDIVVTGEGSIDESTLMGKGVGEVARLAHEAKVRCIGLCGVRNTERSASFDRIYAISPDLVSKEEAMTGSARWLKELAAKAAREI